MSYVDEPSQQRVTTNVVSMPAEEVVPPPPAMSAPVVTPPVTPVTPIVTPVAAQEVRTTYAGSFTPDVIIAGAVGLVALIIGLLVIVRAGLASPLSQPVVKVLGFTHTATLGLVEIAVGLFLLLAASTRSRSMAAFAGLAMVVGGVVGVAQYQSFADSLALERGWAWVVLIAGAVVALAALLLPRMARRTTSVQRTV